ncbi:hypothetical protein GGR53DRAFT_529174 [Hypoxylon sp. FL1150]|nr:hypothetical protein GGR53DRAFT_529174 [Hypoxylon sp. FL1150]
MVDTVRPTPKQFRETYDSAYQAWASLHLHTHPYFPPNLRLKHVPPARKAGPSRLYTTGSSAWGSPPCKDGVDFASFRQRLEIEVAISSPVSLSIAVDEPPLEGLRTPSWFVRADTDFVPVLILAWAYILSARWTELLTEEACFSSPTKSQARHINDLLEQSLGGSAGYVDIGTATLDEIRW